MIRPNARNLRRRFRPEVQQLEDRAVPALAFLDPFVPSQLGGLDLPRALEFRPNGDLLVASGRTSAILRYDGAGNFLGEFVASGSGGLDGVFDFTFGPDGNVYVTPHDGGYMVNRYDGSTGAFLDTFVPAGSGGLGVPTGLCFAPDGDLLVSDWLTDQVLEYRGPNNASEGHPAGEFIGVFASAGSGSAPDFLTFGPDGNLYVGFGGGGTPTPNDGFINRYDGASGILIDTFVSTGEGGLADVRKMIFDQDGNLVVADPASNAVLRYQGPNGAAPGAFIDQFVPPGAGGLSQPVGIAFGSDGLLYVGSRNTDEVLRYGPNKFYVVNDASTNQTYAYSVTGGSGASTTLSSTNTAPRGAASNAAGDKVWVLDANKNVYVYNPSGGLLGSWTAGSMAANATPEGMATNNTDIWIVDSKSDKVFKYAGAASRLSGSQNAAGSFTLNSGNRNPKGIVTDGVHLWVVNDSTTDKVFKYTLAGGLVGSWTITGGGGAPTGITLDPTNVAHLWIVDNATDLVYQYDNAAGRTSGSQAASSSFALAPGNTNPQDIADPPAPGTPALVDTGDDNPNEDGIVAEAVLAKSSDFILSGRFLDAAFASIDWLSALGELRK